MWIAGILFLGCVFTASAQTPAGNANRLNIEYGQAGNERLLLDAHVPEGNGPFPVILVIHGGGWMSGDKQGDIIPEFAPVATNFTWFAINYRLAPANRWPACFEDVTNAILWVKAHAPEFKGDSNRIALMGYSAGGQLATLAGTKADARTRVQAVVGLAPPPDLVADNERRGGLSVSMQAIFGFASSNITDSARVILKENSPLTHVKPGLPPFLIVQGGMDKTVLLSHSQTFVEKLKSSGVPCDLIILTNAQHRIRDWKNFDPKWNSKVAAWLEKKLEPE